MNVNIQLYRDDTTNKPCIVKFPNGLPPLDFIESTPIFKSFSKKVSKTKKARVILSATDKIEYESNSLPSFSDIDEETFQPPAQSSKFAMGIFDRDTNELKLIPTDIYNMNQSIIGYRLTLEKANRTLSLEERREESKKLASDFGSKITKKKIQKMEMENVNNLDYDATNKSILKHQNILADKTSEEGVLDLPPFNSETDQVHEVYPIEDILPSKVYYRLDPEPFINMVNGSTEFDESRYPAYFNEIINSLKERSQAISSDDIEHAGKILAFIDFVLMLMKKRSLIALEAAGIHKDVKNFLTSNFSCNPKKDRVPLSDENLNKIYNYIVILSLHLESYRASNIILLAKALSMTPNQLEKHYSRVGCKSSNKRGSGGETKQYVLHAPLVFPDSKKFRR